MNDCFNEHAWHVDTTKDFCINGVSHLGTRSSPFESNVLWSTSDVVAAVVLCRAAKLEL